MTNGAEPTLRLLNWGHRRATGPMAAAAGRFAELDPVRVEIDVRPLHEFESVLSPAVVDRYDLVIFDHPFCGSVARDRLLRPLSARFAALDDRDFIGPSLASYRYAGELWALPIDGATQTAVYRADLLARCATLPRRFDDVLKLGAAARLENLYLGLACLNPHAFLVVSAFCASLDRPPSIDPWAPPFDRPTLRWALDRLGALMAFVHPDGLRWNAIDLHEAMVARDDIVYCPAAYAYLTYGEADQRRPLSFAPFPGLGYASPRGTVLGGTGLGITRSCRDPAAAERFLAMFADPAAQAELVAGHHGQPGHAAPWYNQEIDQRFGGAFLGTRETVEQAWVRPRFPGAIAFQQAGGAIVASFCAGELDAAATVAQLEAAWAAIRPALPPA